MVQDIVPTRTQAARQRQQQQGGVQQGIREQQLRGNRQERLQQLRIQLRARQQRQQQQQQQQPQQPRPQQQQQQMHAGPGAGRRFHFQVGQLFGFEIAHFVFDRNPPAVGEPIAPGPGPGLGRAPAVAVVDNAANGGDGRAVDNVADQQQQPHRDDLVQEPERDPPALVPADQDPQEQQQQPPPEPQQQQRAEPAQAQEPVPPAVDEDDLGAVAAHAIRVTGAGLGRVIGGALIMPSIARMMGSMLLHISHVVPLIRTIIAPLPQPMLPLRASLPSGPISTLVSIIRGGRPDTMQVGYHGGGHGWLGGSSVGALVLRGLLATSQEWATSDPVWYVSFPCVYLISLSIHVFFTPI
jgi:hypothetical protein